MLLGSTVMFLVETKCFKVILVRSLWRSTDIRLYCNVPGTDLMV